MNVRSTETGPGLYRQAADWAMRVNLVRRLAIAVSAAAIIAGIATYVLLTRDAAAPDPEAVLVMLNVDMVLLLALGALVCQRIVRVWAERRRGLAGSRLMVRLVVLFSLVAALPAIVVVIFSAVVFNLGIEAWFSERVRTALSESLSVTSAYLEEHQLGIRNSALAIAGDLDEEAAMLMSSPALLGQALAAQASLRSILEAIIFDGSGRVLATSGLTFSLQFESIPDWAIERARTGEVAILTSPGNDRVRALVRLSRYFDTYLFVGRIVDARVLGHVQRTNDAVEEYQRLEGKSSGLQISFFLLFATVAILLLLAAVWLGLNFATQLAGPISALIAAAERIRAGDMTARVSDRPEDDEFGILGRTFNRMAGQLEMQREELVEAHRQVDDRRRFTEAVLAGVSAGVIGLDSEGRITLPNRSATELLDTDAAALQGRLLAKALPEMADLFRLLHSGRERLVQSEVRVVRGGHARTLLVRITTEMAGAETLGYVMTFDDITDLLAAQRKAAWSDVARRIAHEIKNPLTPIQLSAERLKRKYLEQIGEDREIFETCTDTIVRHVGDIGRMVDEFSAFARMPAPDMQEHDVSRLVREAIFLQTSANPDIEYVSELPREQVTLRCDERQITQALTNLLKNAAESILDRQAGSAGQSPGGRIALRVRQDGEGIRIEVEDNGKGIPVEIRDRLTEPYVTTRARGTGLGLAIVRKVMEDHGGDLLLEDADGEGARIVLSFRAATATGERASPAPDGPDDNNDNGMTGTDGA